MQAIAKMLKKITAKDSALYKAEFNACLAAEQKNIDNQSKEFARHPLAALTQASAYFSNGQLVNNAMELMRHRAAMVVDRLMDTFAEKQISKLNRVIKQRPISKVVILSGEGDIKQLHYKVVLKNGDSFEVINKIVISYNENLIPITRFPTTFHNVKQGNEFFKSKSQEWMTEFF